MFSNYSNFLLFLKYLVEYECEENNYYENITKVSADNDGKNPLVISDELILNFENIRNNIFSNQKIMPSTVDGLYFNFDKKHSILSLYFIEFKGTLLGQESFKDYFEENIINLTDEQCNDSKNNCPINSLSKPYLNKMFESYTDNVSSILKIKPFESFFVIFPKICEKYANENDVEFSINEFYSFLFEKIRCHLIIVYQSGINHFNDEKTFVASLRDKYNVLKNNGIVFDFKVYDEVEFGKNLLNDIQEFPIDFLYIVLFVTEDVLNKSRDPHDFGNLINIVLKDYVEENEINIDDNQKERLRRIISKCCMNYINN